MAWIDPEEEARTRGYITDPATERVAVRAIMRGVPLEEIIEQFGALPCGLIVARRGAAPDLDEVPSSSG